MKEGRCVKEAVEKFSGLGGRKGIDFDVGAGGSRARVLVGGIRLEWEGRGRRRVCGECF